MCECVVSLLRVPTDPGGAGVWGPDIGVWGPDVGMPGAGWMCWCQAFEGGVGCLCLLEVVG